MVTAEHRPSCGFTTDAYMTVTNLLHDDLRVVTSEVAWMNGTFPDQTVPAGKVSPAAHVSAGVMPRQSHFKLNYETTGEDITVEMGSWPFVTDVTYSSDGATAALLAPLPGSGADYAFLFFAGANDAKRCADSFIRANLPAIAAWIGQNPIPIDLGGDATLTVTTLNVTSENVPCRFATLYPASHDGTRWQLTTIMEITGEVRGTISWKGISSDASVAVSRLAVHVQAIIDLGDPDHVSAAVTRLACSLGAFSVSGALTDVIDALFPAWSLAATDSYTLAGAINTTFNQMLVDALDAAIASWLKSPSLARAIAWIGLAGTGPARPRRQSWRKRAQTADHSTWMSTPTIQVLPLSDLTLPGTHDSATFGLEPVLSQKSYPDIAFLWRLGPDPAPADGSWPFPEGGTIHVGRELMSYVLDTVIRGCTAQIYDLTQQLNDGIRFFDLRIYRDTDGQFYAQHALRGPKFEDLLGQVRSFIAAHPASGELIFLQISATNFDGDQAAEVAKVIREHLGAHIYLPPGAEGVKDFDFQSLAGLTVGAITAGAPKVIVLDTDSDYVYADTVVNTSGFATSGRGPGGTNSVPELAELEGAALDANIEPLYQVSWTLTPQIFDIGQSVLAVLSGFLPEFVIGHLAVMANSALAGFLDQHQGRQANLVTVDWYDTFHGTAPVEVIINLNYRLKRAMAGR